MPEMVTKMRVYTAWSGDGSGSYDASLIYDECDEVLGDVRAALLNGRSILIEPGEMTREEFDEGGPADPDVVKRFRGER